MQVLMTSYCDDYLEMMVSCVPIYSVDGVECLVSVSFNFVQVASLVRQFQICEGNDWAIIVPLCLFVRSVMAVRQMDIFHSTTITIETKWGYINYTNN